MMILLRQMLIFFVIMLLGYYMGKKQILNEEGSKSISWIVVNLANPALIISGCLNLENPLDKKELLYILSVAVSLFVLLIILAHLMPHLFSTKGSETGAYQVMLVFSNFGFMGMPLLSVMYGAKALILASLFMIPFDTLIYTYGVTVVGRKKEEGLPVKNICNVGMLACLFTIIAAMRNIRIPDYIENLITMLSSLTAPLSMLVIGASMVGMPLTAILKNKKLLGFTAVRMVILPVAAGFLIKAFIRGSELQAVSLILFAAPAASMTAMLARQYGGNYEITSQGVAFTTLVSVVTIPLIFALTGI